MGSPKELFLQNSIIDILLGNRSFGEVGGIDVSLPRFNEHDASVIITLLGFASEKADISLLGRQNFMKEVLDYCTHNNKFAKLLAFLFSQNRFNRMLSECYDGVAKPSQVEKYTLYRNISALIIDEINRILCLDGYKLDRGKERYTINKIDTANGGRCTMIKEQINDLIDEGEFIKLNEYHNPGNGILAYIDGPRYNTWMNDIKITANRFFKEHPLYSEIINTYEEKNNSYGTDSYDNMMGYLRSLAKDKEFTPIAATMNKVAVNKKTKIFISHSSADISFVKPFVELLESLGLDEDTIFCSSFREYGVPLGKDIYEYLKMEFTDNELIVFFMLSNNYYSSAACLNEMGASWILQSEYYSILMPNFHFNEIKGAINPNKIAIKLDGVDIKPSLNDLKDCLCSKFNTSISVNKWERTRDSFIKSISDDMKNKKLTDSSKRNITIDGIKYLLSNEDIEALNRFIASLI